VAPTFLTLEEIIAIHRDQIARYGGAEGVRDWGLLHSAMATPAASFGGQFLHSDLYAELVLSVARGERPKSSVAEFFRAHTTPA